MLPIAGHPYVGAGDKVWLWGAQIEVGAAPSSYIPTTTAAVERTADAITATNIAWFNANTGTFLVEGQFPYVDTAARAFLTLDDGGATDRFRFERDASENINFTTTHNSDTDGASNGTGVIAVNTKFKVAGRFTDDDVRACVDGTLSPADVAAAIPLGDAMTTLRLGADSAGNHFNGHVSAFEFYDFAMSNQQMQGLTL